MLESALLLVFPLFVGLAGLMDVLTFTIPNRISVALLGGFWICSLSLGMSSPILLGHLTAGLLMFLVGFAMFALGWIGGGDAKLLAAAALWIGLDHLLPFLFWTALLGGALSIALLTYRSILPPVWLLSQSWAMRLHDRKEGIPYGVAIAGGALIVYPSTFWMTGLAG